MSSTDHIAEKARKITSAVYESHKSLFFQCAVRITQKRELAEDAVHEAFVSILEHPEKLLAMTEHELLKWCMVIVKHKAIDQLRAHSRLCNVSEEQLTDKTSALDNMDNLVVRRELYATVCRYLDALDAESRLILDMKYGLQMSYKEIAAQLHVPEKYVDNHIMLAKRKLRKWMEQEVCTDE